MPIRTKLAIWFGILVATILLLLGGIHYVGNQKVLNDQKDYSLKVVADILDTEIPRGAPSKTEVQNAVAQMIREYPDIEFKGILVEVYDSSRSLVYVSSRSEEQRLTVTQKMWDEARRHRMSLSTLSVSAETGPVRILSKPVFFHGRLIYLIQVGSSMQDVENTMWHSFLLNLIFVPLSILLVSVGGWLLIRKALQPLDTVAQTAHNISSGDLSHRIEIPKAGEEIQYLTEAFNQMITRLEFSFHQIRDFSDNVSHELRIPLSILRGQTELSLRRARSDQEYREILASNLEEIHRLEKIVERLLFLSKADRGDIPLNFVEVDLRELMQTVYGGFRLAARDSKVDIHHDLGRPAIILGDEVFLRELLFNLVQNALQFTPPGGKITLSIREQENEVVLEVADTGTGIAPDDLSRIFDRFYQGDKSRSGQGSGLGLSICKWIAEVHHAVISVQSVVGEGSRFSVVFPSMRIRKS